MKAYVITPEAGLHTFPAERADLIARHESGDWGDVCDEDKATNDRSLADCGMLMSVFYSRFDNTRLYVITDPGHKVVTILTPEEY